MKYNFKKLEEVLTAIINSDFNRNFTSIIAMAYIFDEDDNIFFNKENFGSVASENNFYLWDLIQSKNKYERSLLSEIYYTAGRIF